MAKTPAAPQRRRRLRSAGPVPLPPDAQTNARLRRSGTNPAAVSDHDAPGSVLAAINRTHPRYDEWIAVWTELGHIYEGDGPYLNGDALVPHTRELLYGKALDGTTNFSSVIGHKRKFEQRKQLAHYENFACTIVDLFVDYQYGKEIGRHVDSPPAGLERSPLEDWWQDVDGFGTHIDDWFKRYQTLCNVYGYLYVVMDRQLNLQQRQTNITPAGSKTQPTTLADLGRPVLRVFAPPDAPDWLAPNNQLSAVKFREPLERRSLLDASIPGDFRYYLWDAKTWSTYDSKGGFIRSAPHGFGDLPVTIWYAKRRSRIPILGRSLLRDHTLFRDHYNLISELRELLRSQTFSMLNIVLGENETIEQARERLGDHAGTDVLVFTKGTAQFIAPSEGPASVYTEQIDKRERKAYRLAGLPWESDSLDAESEGSRKLKAADLNAALASLADEAQAVDYWVAKHYYAAVLGGRRRGDPAFKAASVRLSHPDDFNVEQLSIAAADAQSIISIGVGPTATRLIKGQLVPLILRDLDEATRKTIDGELQADADRGESVKEKQAQDILAADPNARPNGEGQPPPGAGE